MEKGQWVGEYCIDYVGIDGIFFWDGEERRWYIKIGKSRLHNGDGFTAFDFFVYLKKAEAGSDGVYINRVTQRPIPRVGD